MKRDQKINYVIFSILLVFVIANCGYHFSPGGENIDKNIQTVYVNSFSNRTSEANLENTLRSAFVDQFRKSSRFRLADRREDADAVLKGTINSLSVSHLSYSAADVAKEGRATLTMELIFEERNAGKIIWSNAAFSWYGDFSVNQADTLRTDINRKSALDKLAGDLADRAFRLIMSGF